MQHLQKTGGWGSRLAHPTRMRILSDYRESKDSSPADLSLLPFPLSPLYSYSFALFCATDVCQLFWNQLDPHSFPRDGGRTRPAIPGGALSARTILVRTKAGMRYPLRHKFAVRIYMRLANISSTPNKPIATRAALRK